MDFGWTAEQLRFRDGLRAFVAEHRTPELLGELEEYHRTYAYGPAMERFRAALDEAGFSTMAWPAEYGGQGKGAFYLFILKEELEYWGMPYDALSVLSVGTTVMRFGSDRQKREWLPRIQTGEMTFAIGYTEPNAGTDLASLQTRAVRDGDEWVINGQKIYTSAAHHASHLFMAARTDVEAPKHRGISVFVFPMDTPGITVRPLWTFGGGRTNETFYEDVRIPADSLVGEENRGWYTIMNALDLERVTIGPCAPIQRVLDQMVEYAREERRGLRDDPVARTKLAEMKLDAEIARALATTNAAIIDSGQTPTMEASMAKVWSSDTKERVTSLAMDLLGQEGMLQAGSGDAAPIGGEIEERWRGTPATRFGGGTNDIQRQIIATRGLGLPRG